MSRDVRFWRYLVPCEPEDKFSGWAVVFMDSTGTFSTVGDYGNWGHKWPLQGFSPKDEPEDFRAFIVRCDGDYVLRKLSHEKIYDADATVREIKRHIVECRRHGSWSKDRARTEWDLLSRCENLWSDHDFGNWYEATTIDDAHEFRCTRPPIGVVAFIERTLPRLKEMLRAELAAEGKAA